MNSITTEKIASSLKSAQRIIILSHTNPDGDTIGCAVSLACALNDIGKETVCLCDCDIPTRLKFICGDLYKKDCELFGGELIICVDVASPEMLGSLCEKFAPIVEIRIDHHKKGTDFAKYNYVDYEAAAAGEIVFEILTCMGLTQNTKALSALYAALSSDTGCFKYSNTTAKTHMIAAYLITLGASHAEVDEALFETKSLRSLQIYPLFLKNCRVLYEGRVNLVTVTNSEKCALSLVDGDLEELSALSRQVEGADLGIVLRQKDGCETEFKVSMRSRKSVNCSLIAAYLGGGGHIRAAGATIIASSMNEAVNILTDALKETLIFEN